MVLPNFLNEKMIESEDVVRLFKDAGLNNTKYYNEVYVTPIKWQLDFFMMCNDFNN